MNYKKCIQNSIEFIEKNLKKDFTMHEVALNCYISYFHFSRIFKAIFGISTSEYVRRRRLSEAAIELTNTEKSILQIALEYRFDSQESFTRNFKKYFEITPGKYRKIQKRIFLYKKNDMFLNLEIINKKGVVEMDIKIVEKKDMKVIGIGKKINYKNTHIEIPKLWEKFCKNFDKIDNKVKAEICYEISSETIYEKEFNNFVCVEVEKESEVPEGMEIRIIPASKYLVFTHKGAIVEENNSTLKQTYEYIYGKYIPNSEYEIKEDYSFELYDKIRFKNITDPNSELDIYIPIK